MKKTMSVVVTVVGLVGTVAAQNPPTVTRFTEFQSALDQVAQTTEMRARAGVQSRVTKGAPYSAETTTEAVQVLGDGNRISRKTMTRVFRDAEGRTRVEQVNASGEVTSVNISDPVAGETYVLNPLKKTASKNGVFFVTPQGAGGAMVSGGGGGGRGTVTAVYGPDGSVRVDATETARRREVETAAAHAGTAVQPSTAPPTTAAASGGGGGGRGGGGGFGGAGGGRGGAGTPTREELGQQVIDGLMATGTRTTTVIAAGAIGNANEIRVVSESWFSDNLKVLVLTKHSDPRVGDTTFRLTNVNRADPAASLFTVPPDYTLEQSFIRRDR